VTALLAAAAFVTLVYGFACWLLVRDERPRRRHSTRGRRT